MSPAEFWDLSSEEFWALWNRRLADVYFTLSHQTKKPMTPNEFLHFGIPETVEARYAREAARYEELAKQLG